MTWQPGVKFDAQSITKVKQPCVLTLLLLITPVEEWLDGLPSGLHHVFREVLEFFAGCSETHPLSGLVSSLHVRAP
eukprot:4243832-Amphidinium_carterae.1